MQINISGLKITVLIVLKNNHSLFSLFEHIFLSFNCRYYFFNPLQRVLELLTNIQMCLSCFKLLSILNTKISFKHF